jgi:Ca2+-binding EF-hand superfamily protein
MLAADLLNAADSNKDGKLSVEEAQAAAKKLVNEADRDKKGSISVQALTVAINSKFGPGAGGPGGRGGPGGPGGRGRLSSLAPGIMKIADADHDGKLTADEAGSAASKFVQKADKDKEGWLDFETVVKLFGNSGGFGPPPGQEAGDYPPRGHGPGDMPAMQLMELVDSNDDDHISPEEAAQAARRLVRDASPAGSVDLDGLREILNHQLGSPFGPGGPPPGGPGGFGGPGGPPPGGPREPE